MYRQIVTPKNTHLLLQIPKEFVGQEVEVIAFTTNDIEEKQNNTSKRTYNDAVKFFRKNAVDFSKIKKWKREDLYE